MFIITGVYFIIFAVAFILGLIITYMYVKINYLLKGTKSHGFVDRYQKKRIKANSDYLKPQKDEFASSSFK